MSTPVVEYHQTLAYQRHLVQWSVTSRLIGPVTDERGGWKGIKGCPEYGSINAKLGVTRSFSASVEARVALE